MIKALPGNRNVTSLALMGGTNDNEGSQEDGHFEIWSITVVINVYSNSHWDVVFLAHFLPLGFSRFTWQFKKLEHGSAIS